MFGGRGRPWPSEREVASDKQTVLWSFAASRDEVVGGMKSELGPPAPYQFHAIFIFGAKACGSDCRGVSTPGHR